MGLVRELKVLVLAGLCGRQEITMMRIVDETAEQEPGTIRRPARKGEKPAEWVEVENDDA